MNKDKNIDIVAQELNIKANQIEAVVKLFAEDATVPFIARYRKELTGNLDEVAIIAIRDRMEQLRELDKRREAILKSLKEQNKLTPELKKQVMEVQTLTKLEDIYLPYRPKRRTRGMIAKEKGLEPLAKEIFAQKPLNVNKSAEKFIDAKKELNSLEDVLKGVRDIIAEWVNEDATAREKMREFFMENSQISSKVVKSKEKEGIKYKDYFDWSEPIVLAPSHRILAIRRGAKEGFLTFHILPDETEAIELLERQFIKSDNDCAEQVKLAIEDSYKRLLRLSMETEMRVMYKKKADKEAIDVFASNVGELLMAPPLGEKAILALDPGLRTGCKLVCMDKQGALLHTDTIYPLLPHNKIKESGETVTKLCRKFNIEAIAIGNGTGGREALAFCKGLGLDNIIITMVNESGASVYSASEVAREELGDYDVTVRGTVSIGRRLMDPLAELVKIDPKSIGVGQYQHDVDQKALKKSLDDVVISCVNAVGVEVNTASRQLLGYVSGISTKIADNIVKKREKEGPFASREDLNKVSGMGQKTFEQAAGFLRIRGAKNPLDESAVHPESYYVVEKMAKDVSCNVADLISNPEIRGKIIIDNYVTDSIGLPTLQDIIKELAKPGRDPRKEFEIFSFSDAVNEIKDVKVGMRLPGVVTNVAAFGAFVDIGVHQDGLVHISQLSDTFVKDPHSVVKVNQKVNVTVLEVDAERKRISLSMKTGVEINKQTGADKEKRIFAPKKTNKYKNNKKKEQIIRNDKYKDSPFAVLGKLLK